MRSVWLFCTYLGHVVARRIRIGGIPAVPVVVIVGAEIVVQVVITVSALIIRVNHHFFLRLWRLNKCHLVNYQLTVPPSLTPKLFEINQNLIGLN